MESKDKPRAILGKSMASLFNPIHNGPIVKFKKWYTIRFEEARAGFAQYESIDGMTCAYFAGVRSEDLVKVGTRLYVGQKTEPVQVAVITDIHDDRLTSYNELQKLLICMEINEERYPTKPKEKPPKFKYEFELEGYNFTELFYGTSKRVLFPKPTTVDPNCRTADQASQNLQKKNETSKPAGSVQQPAVSGAQQRRIAKPVSQLERVNRPTSQAIQSTSINSATSVSATIRVQGANVTKPLPRWENELPTEGNFVLLGPNRTPVHKTIMETITWENPVLASKQLLSKVFNPTPGLEKNPAAPPDKIKYTDAWSALIRYTGKSVAEIRQMSQAEQEAEKKRIAMGRLKKH